MTGERVLERRRLTVGDVMQVLPILSKHRGVIDDIVRAARSGDEAGLVPSALLAFSVIPELLPWIASLYEIDPDELARRPADELIDVIEGLFTGDDAHAFFTRLGQLFARSTGSRTR